jgi:malonyl CoA-acyl carrier protein transacylase
MGQDIFVRFKDLKEQADDILGYDLARLCKDGPIEKLSQTEYTQPALYAVNSLQYLKYLEDGGRTPEYLLGHSVSEYAALFAAGVLDFATGLKIVVKRGELMSEAQGGGMAAVLGLKANEIEEILRSEGIHDVFAANYNTPKQIVLSGIKQSVIGAERQFVDAGASHYKVLQVSGAFHTPFMEKACGRFAEFISCFEFESQNIPVISNVTARPHVDADIAALLDSGLEDARQALVQKIGENINLRRVERVAFDDANAGIVESYVHGGRIGVLIALKGGDEALARDVAMHIAAVNPMCVRAEDVPEDILAKESEIYSAQARESGKPEEIIEKMISGRLKKFIAEVSLMEQGFVKDPDTKVGDLLKESGADIVKFVRFEVGEGIEKEEVDFAAEVAAQANA